MTSLTSKNPFCGKTKLRFLSNFVRIGMFFGRIATEQRPPFLRAKESVRLCNFFCWRGLFLLNISTLFASKVRRNTWLTAFLSAGSTYGFPYTFFAFWTRFKNATRFLARLLICTGFFPNWYAQNVPCLSVVVIATTKSTKFFWNWNSFFVTADVPSRTKQRLSWQPFSFTSLRTFLSTFIPFPVTPIARAFFSQGSFPSAKCALRTQVVRQMKRKNEWMLKLMVTIICLFEAAEVRTGWPPTNQRRDGDTPGTATFGC